MALAPTIEGGIIEAGDDAPAAEVGGPWPRRSLAWYSLALFSLATMMNFFDANVFPLMIEQIKRDFHLTEIQLGLLLGPAGVLFFLVIGIPLARLVDTYRRTAILGIGLIVTSSMTAAGGIVQGYGQLFFSRMMVGVGATAHAPGTYSLLSDLFPPRLLPRAFAFLQSGFIGGLGFASIVGGAMLAYTASWPPTQVGPFLIRNWQWVLIATGIPGLVIAALILMLPEPPRRGRLTDGRALPVREVLREIHARGAVYYPMFIGLALSSVESQGILQWRAPWMERSYGWTPAQIGAWQGITVFVAMPLGVALGTWTTERLAKRYKDAAVRTATLAFALTTPFAIAAPLMPTGELAILMVSIGGVFALAGAVPQNAAIQSITPNEMRGQVTAVYLFMFTVFGALGSFVIALVTTYIVGDPQKLWLSITMVAAVLLPLATFFLARGIKPYGREVQRLEALAAARA